MINLKPRTTRLSYSLTPFRFFARVGIFLSSLLLANVVATLPLTAQDAKLIDDESMRILAKMGEFVIRKGIHPPLADADKIQAVEADDFDAKGFAEKTQEYQKIFLR
jgi:hypothetical protein